MSRIVYNRYWLLDYIDRLKKQNHQLKSIKYKIIELENCSNVEAQIIISEIIYKLERVEYKNKKACNVLEDYLYGAYRAANQLKNQSQEIIEMIRKM